MITFDVTEEHLRLLRMIAAQPGITINELGTSRSLTQLACAGQVTIIGARDDSQWPARWKPGSLELTQAGQSLAEATP
jgi:hypothetical protein